MTVRTVCRRADQRLDRATVCRRADQRQKSTAMVRAAGCLRCAGAEGCGRAPRGGTGVRGRLIGQLVRDAGVNSKRAPAVTIGQTLCPKVHYGFVHLPPGVDLGYGSSGEARVASAACTVPYPRVAGDISPTKIGSRYARWPPFTRCAQSSASWSGMGRFGNQRPQRRRTPGFPSRDPLGARHRPHLARELGGRYAR